MSSLEGNTSDGIFTAKLVNIDSVDEPDLNPASPIKVNTSDDEIANELIKNLNSGSETIKSNETSEKKDIGTPFVLPPAPKITKDGFEVKAKETNSTTEYDKNDASSNIDVGNVPVVVEENNTKPNLKSVLKNSPSEAADKKGKHVSFETDHIEKHYQEQHWALGALGRIFSLRFAPISIPLERRLQTFGVLFWMSSFLFMGFGSLFVLLYLFFFTKLWWISVCYLTWFIGDRSICNRGGRRYELFRNWSLWKHTANFYPVHMIKTADLPGDRHYIMGYHPHGILCSGAFCHFATNGTEFGQLFPEIKPHLLTLEGHFLLPIYREFFMSTGGVSATKESMNYLLSREKKGNALCLVVGGAPEALDCHPGMATLTLNKRKGFCKIALRHGSSLVPMYSFGENEVYDQIANPQGSWMRWFQDTLQKYIGLAPAIFMGRGVFQYSFGIVPFRKPIYTVVGAPIHVKKTPNPTQKEIEDLHARYVIELKALYDKYRYKYSQYPEVDLTIT